MYNSIMPLSVEYEVLCEYLRDGGAQRQRMLSKTRQCHECGMVFSSNDPYHDQAFWQHKKNHYYENFRCDCEGAPATDDSLTAKRRHVQLFHSDGEYSKCQHCDFVGK